MAMQFHMYLFVRRCWGFCSLRFGKTLFSIIVVMPGSIYLYRQEDGLFSLVSVW